MNFSLSVLVGALLSVSAWAQSFKIKLASDGRKEMVISQFEPQSLTVHFTVQAFDTRGLEWLAVENPSLPFLCKAEVDSLSRGLDSEIALSISGPTCDLAILKMVYSKGLRINYRIKGSAERMMVLDDHLLNECDMFRPCEVENPKTFKVPLSQNYLVIHEVKKEQVRFADLLAEKIWAWDLNYNVDLQTAYLLCRRTLGAGFKLPSIEDVLKPAALNFVFNVLNLKGNFWTSSTIGSPKQGFTFSENALTLIPVTSRRQVLCIKNL
jgi:hypothetical protein